MSIRSVRGFIIVVCAGALVGLSAAADRSTADDNDVSLTFENASGQIRTIDVTGDVDSDNPFFQELGRNGRTCFSCHRPAQGWTVTPQSIRARFAATAGLDPIFRPNDGSNCEGADVSTVPRRLIAFSLLLKRGLIRIGIDVPTGAEFVIESVDDPYQCGAPLTQASMYRRPLPSTNLKFLSAVMWDGRESSPTTTILQDLAKQADAATMGHAEASLHLTPAQAQQIVAFETGLFTAQRRDKLAGSLTAAGALGGPVNLSQQLFFIGINDPVDMNPTGAPFDPRAFTIFEAWASSRGGRGEVAQARAAIARGQEIFNTKPIVIQGVAGLNNETFPSGVRVPDPFTGSCTTCHDTPNAGNHSVKAPLNIGLSDASRRTPDMPLYTLRRLSGAGEQVQTTDPGRAMITGKWADIGKFKGPILRGLAARAPYFHNGSAETVMDVVEFYDSRFNIGLTAREKADLVAFLLAL
jgi:cytochrome c peroxidase